MSDQSDSDSEATREQTEPRYRSSSLTLCGAASLLVPVFTDAPTSVDLDALDKYVRSLEKPYLSFVVVSAAGRLRLDREARERVDALARISSGWVVASVMVILGEGFVRTTARALIARSTFLMRDHPMSVFSSFDDAYQFSSPFLSKLSHRIAPTELQTFVERCLSAAGVPEVAR